jgi:hypothetical protein
VRLARVAESGRCWHENRSSQWGPVITGNESRWSALALSRPRAARAFRQPAVPVKWSPLPAKPKDCRSNKKLGDWPFGDGIVDKNHVCA